MEEFIKSLSYWTKRPDDAPVKFPFHPTRLVIVIYLVKKETHSGYCSWPSDEDVKIYTEKIFIPCPLDFHPEELPAGGITLNINTPDVYRIFHRKPQCVHFCCSSYKRYELIRVRIKDNVRYQRNRASIPYVIKRKVKEATEDSGDKPQIS